MDNVENEIIISTNKFVAFNTTHFDELTHHAQNDCCSRVASKGC